MDTSEYLKDFHCSWSLRETVQLLALLIHCEPCHMGLQLTSFVYVVQKMTMGEWFLGLQVHRLI